MCARVCAYVRTSIRVCAYMYTRMCVEVCAYVRISIRVCAYKNPYIHTYAYTRLFISIYELAYGLSVASGFRMCSKKFNTGASYFSRINKRIRNKEARL